VTNALADFVKAIQGMMGKARTSQSMHDLQQIVDATQAHLQAHPNKFEKITTPDDTRNTQRVPRVQALPSFQRTHIDYNRRITRSMQPQPPVPRVPTNKPTCKSTSNPLIKTTNDSTGKPACTPDIKPTTSLPADMSKQERLQKQQAP
jgi:hypothetical protein